MLASLSLATVMVAATVLFHFLGLIRLTKVMGTHGVRLRPHESRVGSAVLLLMIVFGVFALHTAEIWAYAVLYRFLGETSGFEEALYYSTCTFAAIGYGDVVLSEKWRLLGAIEGANGVILFAWSTAFLLSVTTRLKILDHTWLSDATSGN